MDKIYGEKALPECHFSITTFSGYFDTIPAYELAEVTWSEIVANIATADGPILVKSKEDAPYFVPCSLHIAPYIGKTREKAIREGWPSLDGKQRSALHCMASAILKYDLDGVTAEQWATMQEKLNASRLTFLAYSTWSYGLAEKPGVRVRVLIPMDRALIQADYHLAWWGAAEVLFAEFIGGALDPSAGKIHQQQGVWSTAPDREQFAFRIHVKGGVASADTVIAVGKIKHSVQEQRLANYRPPFSADSSMPPDIARLTEAQRYTPDDYDSWIKVGQCYKALTPTIGEDTAHQLWIAYCIGGSNKSKNDDPAYSPDSKWGTFFPSMTIDAALGTLFGMARDGALAVVEAERGKPALSDRGRAAAKYLASHHRALFNQLTKGVA